MRAEPRFALLLVCFFLSGLAGLIYQTAWTRQLAFVFGTSELAVVTVLAAYMGGLAAGAAAATRFVSGIRRPVLVYGLLELGIAASALAVPAAIAATTALHVAVFGGRADTAETAGLAPALFTFIGSAAILLVPTGLMGATLPLLARHAVRHEGEIGPRVGAHLSALARHHQVLCVTHLPAIAAVADRHLRVTKAVAKGRTRTSVDHLAGDARVEEIAAMIAGAGDAESARAEARRLLEGV